MLDIEDMSMEEKREILNVEFRRILKRANQETDQCIKKLKEKGFWQGGLDGKHPELDEIDNKAKEEIRKKAKELGCDNIEI